MLGKIGIIVIALHLPLSFPPFIWISPFIFLFWIIGSFNPIEYALIGYGVFPSTLIAGLILYVIGRKEFSDYVKERQIVSGLVTFLGFILVSGSLFSFLFFVMALGVTGSSGVRPPVTLKGVAVGLLGSIWFGLGFISGLLLLIDGGKMREDKAPMKKEIDLEEAWKKYTKDLFTKYVERYPHNPTGVLEWHIDKKMKEGITRERAIEELTEESEQSKLS